MWSKIKTWFGTIPLTVIAVIVLAILVLIFRAPLGSLISSIQAGLKKGSDDEEGKASAVIISEENKSVVPENPKNYQDLGRESSAASDKVLDMLDQTLEALKNAQNPVK